MNLISRSIVFVITLLFIYLLFPILIVPSSLPAIQQMMTGPSGPARLPDGQADIDIYQLEIERVPTLQDKVKVLVNLHRQGMALILKR